MDTKIAGQSRAELEAERRKLEQQVKETLEGARKRGVDLTATQSENANAALSRCEEIDGLLAQFPKGAPAVFGGYDAPGTSRGWKRFAIAKGELRHELTYRPDAVDGAGFWRDQVEALRSSEAREKIERNNREAADAYGMSEAEARAMSNSSTAGGDFVPPLYLADMWVQESIAKRPLADALPGYPLPEVGTSISIPKLSSGVSVAPRADLGAVSSTDGVTDTVTHTVNEIAGMEDVGRIAVYRSEPGLQMVLTQTLLKKYAATLDSQLLVGNGTAPQHVGLHGLSGVNAVTYTSSSPTITELLPLIYKGIDAIYEARAGNVTPDLIVMAPRRSGWIGYQSMATIPVAQQAGLAAGLNFGTQDGGFLRTFAGLEVVIDPNVGTTYGTGTNQDEIYILAREDFFLSEGPLMSRVHEDVGSATGFIRFAVFAFSAFLSKRYPGSCTIISGTGLTAPAWT